MSHADYTIEPIGFVRSTLARREGAPRQPDEGAPEAWLEIEARVADGIADIAAGDELLVLTWLHRARRETLRVHPRDRPSLTGVFSTRSPDRPNPIGVHRVTVVEVAGTRLKVAALEAIDGTPIVDIKPVLARLDGQ
jgi:tRNA-Thr(GGU) m(6)t(6)A37 methyltransferase TsaA